MNNRKIIIGRKGDFEDNAMKTVEVEGRDGKVLVFRIDGEFFAVSPSCTHYGAPHSLSPAPCVLQRHKRRAARAACV